MSRPPHLVAKRNARERRRVQAVNQAFYKLRKCVPIENRNKRVSKVKTLQRAIDYIRKLERILEDDDSSQQQQQQLSAGTSQVVTNVAPHTENNTMGSMASTNEHRGPAIVGQQERANTAVAATLAAPRERRAAKRSATNCDQANNSGQQQEAARTSLDNHQLQIIKQRRGRKSAAVAKCAPDNSEPSTTLLSTSPSKSQQLQMRSQSGTLLPSPNNCHQQQRQLETLDTTTFGGELYAGCGGELHKLPSQTETYMYTGGYDGNQAHPLAVARDSSVYRSEYYQENQQQQQRQHNQYHYLPSTLSSPSQQQVFTDLYGGSDFYAPPSIGSHATQTVANYRPVVSSLAADTTTTTSSSLDGSRHHNQQQQRRHSPMGYSQAPALNDNLNGATNPTSGWPNGAVSKQAKSETAGATNLAAPNESIGSSASISTTLNSSASSACGGNVGSNSNNSSHCSTNLGPADSSTSISFALLRSPSGSSTNSAVDSSSPSTTSTTTAATTNNGNDNSLAVLGGAAATVVCRPTSGGGRQQVNTGAGSNSYLAYVPGQPANSSDRMEARASHLSFAVNGVSRANNDNAASYQQQLDERKSGTAIVELASSGSHHHQQQQQQHQVALCSALNGSRTGGLSANNLHEQRQQYHHHQQQQSSFLSNHHHSSNSTHLSSLRPLALAANGLANSTTTTTTATTATATVGSVQRATQFVMHHDHHNLGHHNQRNQQQPQHTSAAVHQSAHTQHHNRQQSQLQLEQPSQHQLAHHHHLHLLNHHQQQQLTTIQEYTSSTL